MHSCATIVLCETTQIKFDVEIKMYEKYTASVVVDVELFQIFLSQYFI